MSWVASLAMRQGRPTRHYDASLDGRRFLLLKDTGEAPVPPPPQLTIVLNWIEELTRLLPAN